ncbi:hypothetical protein BH09PAT1_BH09PAT1_7010 [soil metagenome]
MKEKIASWLSNLANNPGSILFYLLLVSIPSQFGRHFWPSFAFINGLRVDYLSPTLYVSDVLIGLLLVELLPFLMTKVSKVKILLVVLILGLFGYLSYTSLSPINSLFGLLRLFEIVVTTWFISHYLSLKKIKAHAQIVISFSLVITMLLSVWQFVSQSSVGGLWYYLGERTFTSLTPGIANASLAGNLVLRPYATFPHPNVLVAFSVVMVTFLLFSVRRKNKFTTIFIFTGVVSGVISALLSMSRSGIAVLGLILFIWLINLLRTSRKLFVGGISLIILAGIIIAITQSYLRFTDLHFSDETIVIREFLLGHAYTLFLHHPLTGVGLQNFLPTLAKQISPLTPLSYFQPVHSVYFLILAETGLLGTVLVILLGILICIRIARSKGERLVKSLLLLIVLLLSLTDHYFYTLHQGQLLLAFILGVIFTQPTPLFTSLEAKNHRKSMRSHKTKKSLSSQPLKNSRTGTSSKTKPQLK